ncbi:MAG: ATP-dependent RecD-like DNA helicase [Defluviitaleaceae bacterium]|nr:ATP-dependent RecD-like DNA helicase [Defluviitaleaceae bacterium]
MSNLEKAEALEGMIEGIIYHNEENGYTVFILRPNDLPGDKASGGKASDDKTSGGKTSGDEDITCTGFLSNPLEGESIKVVGSFVTNPKYGRQFSVTRAERVQPSTLAGIEKYLASGVIKGVGAKTAKQIVARFGENTFDVIENDPEKLSRIRGISLKKAISISECFHAQHDQRRAMLFLQEYGITPAASMKIYKRYKEDTIETVKFNPYRLADDIDGIGFKTADAIAYRLGVSRDAPERISAGVRFCLWEATNDGHTYMPTSALTRQASEILICDQALVENELSRMQMERHIIREKLDADDEPLVFVNTLYYAELRVARKLIALNAAFAGGLPEPFKQVDSANGLSLSESQHEAVKSALTQGVLILTGGPGTGKTTTINTIITLLEQKDLKVMLAAPTGRAAKRMSEATGRDAKTIHRLLEVSFISEDSRRQVFQRNEENPLETDVLVVDETSMMDILLMHSLLKAVADGTRLILVGDVDQLPSVGPGNVLKDLISSGCLPVARLTEIFRQAAESAIITNAHRINKGDYPEINDKEKDFFFMRRQNPEDVAGAILELIATRLPAYKNFDTRYDIQVLTPMRKSALGVVQLNNLLQARLNPRSVKKREREYGAVIFREGDKVMQIRNNYDATWESYNAAGYRTDFGEGVFNGDMGIVYAISEETLTVQFDDNRRVSYDFSQLDELELAYAVTVHKSQGSEYRAVIIPIFSGPPMLLTRNLLYTAVTRAKELAILVGVPETMFRMIDNNRVTSRYTALARRLRDIHGASEALEPGEG